MLSERNRELLSAYVDGELNARQIEAVRQLLRTSADARMHLEKLKADAGRLQSLARHPAAKDLVGGVRKNVAWLKPQPAAAPLSLSERRLAPWIGFPAAAAVLVAVFAGSYFYLSTEPRNAIVSEVVASGNVDSVPVVAPVEAAVVANAKPQADEPAGSIDANPSAPAHSVAAVPAPKSNSRKKQATKSLKRELDGVLTTPSVSQAQFELVDPMTSLALALRELDQKPLRQKLLKALKPGEAYRLELTGSANAKAVEMLSKAFQALGVQFTIEELAQQRSRLPRSMTDYTVVTDDLTPAEVVNLLNRLGKADRDADAKKSDAARFLDLIVLPWSQEDHKDLAKLLGVEQTAATASARSVDAAAPRQALLLTYNPPRPQPNLSKEIKRFLETRTPSRPDTVKIILVFRAVLS